MKIKNLLLFGAFIFSGCLEISAPFPSPDQYYLGSISCFCQPVPTYARGHIVWEFDTASNQLHVITSDSVLLRAGTYTYRIVDTTFVRIGSPQLNIIQDSGLVITGHPYVYQYNSDGAEFNLYLDHSPYMADDEFRFNFEKM